MNELIALVFWLAVVGLFFKFVWPRWARRMEEQHRAARVQDLSECYDEAISIVIEEEIALEAARCERELERRASRILEMLDDEVPFALDAEPTPNALEYRAAADGRRSA